MISGGSSSGSALAVALGQVPFAVATDTAGSGRVPAALNGVVGFKPSRGLISTVGLVPGLQVAGLPQRDGRLASTTSTALLDVMVGRDDDDPWSRDRGPRYDGVGDPRRGCRPSTELEFFGDDEMRSAHLAFREHLAAPATVVDVSLEPFLAAGALLYQGPWVAERLVEFGDFLAAQPDSIHPVVRDILRGGQQLHRRRHVRRTADDSRSSRRSSRDCGSDMDVLVVPTIGTTFTVDEVLERADRLQHDARPLHPLRQSARPAGRRGAGGRRPPTADPSSAMLLGAALTDDIVLQFAAQLLDEPRERSAPSRYHRPNAAEEHV